MVEVDGSCVFWLTGSDRDQEVVSEVPNGDPLPAYIKVKTENIGYGEIYKKDEASGVNLAGAVYGIYSDSVCTSLVEQITTDGNGYAKSKALPTGTYYLKEIKAPNRYVVSGTVYPLQVRAGQTETVTMTDKEQLGAITIYKEGEVLTGWNGSNFTYEKRRLPGAAFRVTAGADIFRGDGTKVYQKGDTVAENLVTGAGGSVVLPGLPLGTYVVTETKSIDGYAINRTPKTVTVSYQDQTVEVQSESAGIYNNRQTASVTVAKEDSATGNPLDGGTYSLYVGNDIRTYDGGLAVKKGTLLQTVTTGADGTAAFSADLPIGNSYYVSESQAPSGYVRDEADVYSFHFGLLPETKGTASFSHTFANDRVTAKIHLYKLDQETKKAVPQGDASLSGAVYGLYAGEDIVHPDGATGVLCHAGELVTSITTDEKGEAEVEGLYLGKYYLKETQAPEGYLPDPEKHEVTCSYEGDLVPEVARSVASEEQVYKQPFQLIKVSDNGEDTEAPALAGAGFSAYLKSSLEVLADGSYDLEHAEKVAIGTGGETTLYTDEKGYLVTQALPYGTYVVKETVVPHNRKEIRPFEVSVTENHPEEPQVWRIFMDREFTAKLRIVKKDQKTGKTVLVPDAEFKIYDLDRKEYVTQYTTYPTKVKHTSFFTDGDGDLILPEKLKLGDYRIEEVAAPEGYVVNEKPMFFSVDTDTAYETDPDTYEAVITAECADAPATGELTIEKKGEFLEAYRGGFFADSEDKEFVYREGTLAGAEFEVYAAEDICTNDGQKDENGERIRYYEKGELVGTLVTDENGRAVLSGLPLGTYRVKETKAPYGYVLDPKEQTVKFAYADDRTPVIKETLTFTDDRQKVSLSVLKLDSETELPVAGAEFGLYAAEDIRDAEGNTLVEADTLLERAVSGSSGKAVFGKDYPLGQYYTKELKAPDGYVSSDATLSYDASYQGQETAVLVLETEFKNLPTRVGFTKTDLTSGEELSGATLSVLDEEGNLIETWTSEAGKPHVIERLHVGETYTLKEEFAPYGYLQAEEIRFTVSDTGELQEVEMQDAVPIGTILINKDGEFLTDIRLAKGHWYDFIFRYFRKSLAGVTFEVYAAEDIVSPDGLDTVLYEKD